MTVADTSVVQMPLIKLEESLHIQESATSEIAWLVHLPAKAYASNLEENASGGNPVSINLITTVLLIFLAGVVVNLFLLFKSFFLMFRLFRVSTRLNRTTYQLCLTTRPVLPFSWFNYLFISTVDYENHAAEILNHETAHIRYKHSLDVLYFEFLVMLQWFNPAIWLLKRELKGVHEYQADSSVLQSGIDATRYQLLLVKKAVGAKSYSFANSLNHSKIKKRITMMLKENSKNCAKWKLLLLLPALSLMLAAFAKPEPLNEAIQIKRDESTKKMDDPEKYSKEYFKKEYEKLIEEISADKTLSEKDIIERAEKGFSSFNLNVFTTDNDVSKADTLIELICNLFTDSAAWPFNNWDSLPIFEGYFNLTTSDSFVRISENKYPPVSFLHIHFTFQAKEEDDLSKEMYEDEIWKLVQESLSKRDDLLLGKMIVTVKTDKKALNDLELKKSYSVLGPFYYEGIFLTGKRVFWDYYEVSSEKSKGWLRLEHGVKLSGQ
ncbi:MAG: M56 family metallopeptidase [Leptospirales bacterium]|nr:M56 family metallopeptidase [Leptospirales bacterium]